MQNPLGARLFILALLSMAAISHAQLPSPPRNPDALNSVDSLKRVITRRILSDADKKAIRSCDREKYAFLKKCRDADTANAGVDRRLNEAKLKGANQADTAVQSLLEKKFLYEKGCDDVFAATAKGKQCLAGETERRAALEKALKKDAAYQELLRKSEAEVSGSL